MESVFQGALFVILLMTVETTVTNHEQMAFKNAIYFCKKLCMYVCVFARVCLFISIHEKGYSLGWLMITIFSGMTLGVF